MFGTLGIGMGGFPMLLGRVWYLVIGVEYYEWSWITIPCGKGNQTPSKVGSGFMITRITFEEPNTALGKTILIHWMHCGKVVALHNMHFLSASCPMLLVKRSAASIGDL